MRPGTRLALVVAAAGTALAALPAAADKPAAPAAADDPYVPPKGYVCYRATSPVTLDGKLDEDAWNAAPWSDAFADIEGDQKPAPTHATRFKMLWDDRCLYVGAQLDEPHVWATLKEHDGVIFRDNDFEVFLDPDGDSHLYAELELNALNTTWDLLLTKPYKDGGKAVNAWEITGLKTAVHVDGTLNDPADRDANWSVEIAWPWEGLKELSDRPVPPRDGDQMRINFSRVEWDVTTAGGKYTKVEKRPEHNWVWSPQGVIDMHRPERWGYVQFSTAPPGKVAFKPDPTGPARHLLHRVYYAQVEHRKKHGAWAKSLDELGLKGLTLPELAGPPRLEVAGNAWEASATARDGKGPWRRVVIRDDARVRVE